MKDATLIGLPTIKKKPLTINQILKLVPSEEVNRETLVAEFNQAIVLAKRYRQPSAMVAAIKAKAQLHGLLVDKTEHSGEVVHTHSVKKIDLNERIEQIVDEKLAHALQ